MRTWLARCLLAPEIRRLRRIISETAGMSDDAGLFEQEPFVQLLLGALGTGAVLQKVVTLHADQCEGLEGFAYLDNAVQYMAKQAKGEPKR